MNEKHIVSNEQGWECYDCNRVWSYEIEKCPICYKMSKKELVEKWNLENKSFDYSLPQDWVYAVLEWCRLNNRGIGYRDIVYGFVWLYDEKSRVFGRPYPLIPITHWLLKKLPRNLMGEG